MKLTLALLSLTILTGCAIRDMRPPWERFEKTHEPLMSVPTPNPNWP